MRVLVAWAGETSPNLGVRALGQGSADLLRRVFGQPEIEYMDFGNRPPQLPWGRPRSLMRERLTGRAGMMDWLGGFDVLWDTRSGDSFADIYGPARHAKMALVHEFAAQAGVATVIAPQTIGPFRSLRGRALARRNLRRSRLAFARDPLSAAAASALGRPVDATATDLVFGIEQPQGLEATRDVLLNVSGLLWKPSTHVDNERYRSNVRSVIDQLLAAGRSITLLPHVLHSHDSDNDVPVSVALAEEYSGRIDVRVPDDLDDARRVISASQVVIGARMHACLNALSTGVPAVAMAYSRKFAPLMDSIGWDNVVSLRTDADPATSVISAVNDRYLAEKAHGAMLTARDRLSVVHPLVADLA